MYPSEVEVTSTPIESAHSAAAIQLSSSAGVSESVFSVLARMNDAPKAGPIKLPSLNPPIVDVECKIPRNQMMKNPWAFF